MFAFTVTGGINRHIRQAHSAFQRLIAELIAVDDDHY